MSAPLETYREWYRKKMRADSISFHDTLVLYLAAHDYITQRWLAET